MGNGEMKKWGNGDGNALYYDTSGEFFFFFFFFFLLNKFVISGHQK